MWLSDGALREMNQKRKIAGFMGYPMVEITALGLEEQLLGLLKGEHSSLSIGINEETGPNYRTVVDAVEDGIFDNTHWVSEEEKQRAIETNRVWTIHWYPNTPVGFHALSASTLSAVLSAAFGDRSDE